MYTIIKLELEEDIGIDLTRPETSQPLLYKIKLHLSQFQINLTFQHWKQLQIVHKFWNGASVNLSSSEGCLCTASNFALTKNWARNANSIRQENLIFTEYITSMNGERKPKSWHLGIHISASLLFEFIVRNWVSAWKKKGKFPSGFL